jgi:hypothetical protein
MADNDEGMWGCIGFFAILGILSSIPWLMGTYPGAFAGIVAVGFAALVVLGRVMESRERTPSPPPPPEIQYLENPPPEPLRFEEARDWRVEPVMILEGPRCLICRSGLGDDVIFCWRCRTPHHRRCFRYAGECAVYACKCRRYRRAG